MLRNDPVDSEADLEPVLRWQEVDVACASFDRVGDDTVEGADGRRVALVALIGCRPPRALGPRAFRTESCDISRRCDRKVYGHRRHEPQLVDEDYVRRIGDSDLQAPVFDAIGEQSPS